MITFSLSFPRLNISLNVSEEISADIEAAFFHAIQKEAKNLFHHEYHVRANDRKYTIRKDGQAKQTVSSSLELICLLEEDIETALMQNLGDWVGFHAGAVKIGAKACVIPGNPDTGKTVTTFNLVEMGNLFLCEEVAPVDPKTLLVHPYPQVLSIDASYAEKHVSNYPVQYGELDILNEKMARYQPYSAGTGPVPLGAIILPAYHPFNTPGIEKVAPDDVFTELLGYCFPPGTDDEYLFDAVIHICNEIDIYRLQTNSVESLRNILGEFSMKDKFV